MTCVSDKLNSMKNDCMVPHILKNLWQEINKWPLKQNLKYSAPSTSTPQQRLPQNNKQRDFSPSVYLFKVTFFKHHLPIIITPLLVSWIVSYKVRRTKRIPTTMYMVNLKSQLELQNHWIIIIFIYLDV